MATIPSGTKFHTVPADVETQNKGSKLANAQRNIFTIEDVKNSVAPKMLISFMGQSGTGDPYLQGPYVADFLPSIMSRNAVGQYQIIFPAGTLTNKTIVTILPQAAIPATASGLINVSSYWYADSIQITTKNPATNALTDGYLDNAIIQIQVFP
jgi:hypothetical protein